MTRPDSRNHVVRNGSAVSFHDYQGAINGSREKGRGVRRGRDMLAIRTRVLGDYMSKYRIDRASVYAIDDGLILDEARVGKK